MYIKRSLIMKKSSLPIVLSLMLSSTAFMSHSNDFSLGLYELNRGEFQNAIAQFTPLLAEGYAPAQYQMGLIHLNGYGVQKDARKAFEFFELAALQNYPDAQFNLALMYSEGDIVKKDLKKAFALTEKAARKGLESAQFNLGVMYYNGEGVRQDYYQASKWYKRAAEMNYPLAQFNLALMYFEGKGVEKSTEMSYVWNIIAANNGYKSAEKSRDMDEHKLTVEQIKSGREKAEDLSRKIFDKVDRRDKKSNINTY